MRMSIEDSLISTINDMYLFEDELTKLSLKVYPSVALRELIVIELIPIVIDLRSMLITEKQALHQIPQTPVSASAKAVQNIWSSNILQIIAKAISGADIKSHPLEIMIAFREMISNIEGSEFEIITSPSEEINFTFREIWLILKEKLTHELGINRQTSKKFIQLTFPRKHKDNVFSAGIYAHEIGHYFDRNRKLWAKIFTQTVRGHAKLMELACFFRKNNGQMISEVEILTILENSVMGSWLREAIADCVAIYLVGPSFILSSTDLIISIYGKSILHGAVTDFPSISHPRHGLRNKFQMQALKNIGLYDHLHSEIKEHLDNIADDWENAALMYQPQIIGDNNIQFQLDKDSYLILEEIWQECLSQVESEVSNLVGVYRIKTDDLDEAFRLADERLKWLVPPNEIDEAAASYSAIINSGWYAMFLFKQEISSSVARLDGDRSDYDFRIIINELLRYALHASKIKRSWN